MRYFMAQVLKIVSTYVLKLIDVHDEILWPYVD